MTGQWQYSNPSYTTSNATADELNVIGGEIWDDNNAKKTEKKFFVIS